jgi:hypothetical protein
MTANTYLRGWDVQSRSDPDRKHRVSVMVSGRYGCSCGAWKFARAPKPDCHHIREVKENLGVPARRIPVGVAIDALNESARSLNIPRAPLARVTTAAFVITEVTQAELLAGPLRRKVRKPGDE